MKNGFIGILGALALSTPFAQASEMVSYVAVGSISDGSTYHFSQNLSIDPASGKCLSERTTKGASDKQKKIEIVQLADQSASCRFLKASIEIEQRTVGCKSMNESRTFVGPVGSNDWFYFGGPTGLTAPGYPNVRSEIKADGCFCLVATSYRKKHEGAGNLFSMSAAQCARNFARPEDQKTVLKIYRAYDLL